MNLIVEFLINMIQRIKYDYYRVKLISNSFKFKSNFLLCIICTLICSYNVDDELMFENAIMFNISSGLYQMLLFLILFISSIFTMNAVNKDYNSFLRYQNKKEYMISLIKTITYINIITYIIYSLFGLIFIIIKYLGSISFIQFEYYQIPFFIYNIYLYFKYFVILNMLIIISIMLYKNIGKILGSVIGFLLLIFKDGYPYNVDKISSVENIHLFYGYYLSVFEYSSFTLDLCAFFLECTFLLLIYEFMKYLNLRFVKVSIEE